jgi:AraC-like DNA-binding protein
MHEGPHDERGIARGQAASRERAIARALAYIELHFCEALSLDEIATAAHVSKFHFARLFRRRIGTSPMQYVRWRRIQEAKQLIHAGRVPLTSIATSLGYFDHSHFSRSFRAATGLSPHQYLTLRGGDDGDALRHAPPIGTKRDARTHAVSFAIASPAFKELPCPSLLTPRSTTTA